jgi:hypothetical protein
MSKASIFFFLLSAMTATSVIAENLFPAGDFTSAKKDLSGLAVSNGGRTSLFQEEYTWNNCGKLEIVRAYTNATDKSVVFSANAWIGGDGTKAGLPVEPDSRYDFSLEVRGEVPKATINVQVWGDDMWGKDSRIVKADIQHIAVQKTWTLYKGSFVAPKGAKRAAVSLLLWASTRYPPVRLKVGDCVYFDNVKFEKAQDGFAALGAKGKRKATPVSPVKTLIALEKFDDFNLFVRNRGCVAAARNPPKVAVSTDGDSVVIETEMDDPSGIAPGEKGVWTGDVLEVFFGPASDNSDRKSTQIVWNPFGERYCRPGKENEWILEENSVSGTKWRSRVRIPFSFLGFRRSPKKGETVAFNICYTRKNAKELYSWAPVRDGFGQVESFGRLALSGSYADVVDCAWGVKEKCDTRQDCEKRMAELSTAAKQAELDRLSDTSFTVAAIPVDSDYSIPFTPRESFNPPAKIELKAAVNERVGMPVAILNLLDRPEEYVVRLETDTASPDPDKAYAEKQFNGVWGLKGFPPSQIEARHALRFKDTDNEPVTLRLEQLPRMNEACTIQVPPKEAGVAWFDFDTSDVAPGVYEGRLRVIPLGAASKWEPFKGVAYHHRMYSGRMQDIPVRLEVRPIVLSKEPAQPGAFFQYAETEGQFKLMADIGTRDFQISPWSFAWDLDGKGNIDFSRPKPQLEEERKRVEKMLEWSRKYGIKPTFFIGFSAYRVFQGNYGTKSDPAKNRVLWPQYLQGVKRSMNEWGIPDADYAVEVWDEPNPSWFGEIRESLTLAKASLPGVKLLITLGAHIMPAENMAKIDPFIDGWVLWRHGYFSRSEHLEYVADALKRGKQIWHYTCSTSGRAPIFDTYRLHPWFAWRHNLTGNQFFIFQGMTGGFGPSDFKTAASSGIAYRSFESTMPSLRYMSMRRGVEDVKYLAKLKEVAGDEPEVKEFLASAPERVVERERHDRTAPDRVREEAANLILKYKSSKRNAK